MVGSISNRIPGQLKRKKKNIRHMVLLGLILSVITMWKPKKLIQNIQKNVKTSRIKNVLMIRKSLAAIINVHFKKIALSRNGTKILFNAK